MAFHCESPRLIDTYASMSGCFPLAPDDKVSGYYDCGEVVRWFSQKPTKLFLDLGQLFFGENLVTMYPFFFLLFDKGKGE